MTRDNLLIFITDLIYFGLVNGWQVYLARQKKQGEISLRLKQYPHPIFIRCGTSDFEVFDQIFKSREYNIDIPVSEQGCIIDAGANIGLASIYLLHKFPQSKIIALEPEERNYHQLIKNTQHYPQITPLKKALWFKRTQLSLEGDAQNTWGFIVTENTVEKKNVEAVTVTDLKKKFHLEEIDVLKIDIEGAEKEVFTFDYEVWLPSVKTILIEFHDLIRPGSGRAFFTAILKYNYLFRIKGEKIIALRQDRDKFSQ